MQGWVVVATAVLYLAFLFAVASWGDKLALRGRWRGGRPFLYAMTLCVYCTSWTFFGSVGLSARTGLDFLPVYLGPALMIGLGYPILLRIVRLAKDQNITSIADFIAARYGKSPQVAAVVTLILVVGVLPYIALQLKAISASVGTMVGYLQQNGAIENVPILADSALLVAFALALFAILFGTRHIDATEHQDGMMLAIATESIVKLGAFLVVGIFITYSMFDGPQALWAQAEAAGTTLPPFGGELHGGTWVTITALSLFAIILLPRQFHVTVVENHSESEIRRAIWLFPVYLVLINLFVLPIAVAGLLTFGEGAVDADMFVLALPMAAGSNWVTLVAFIGGLSAATAMVIVESVALSIMVCNDLVVPFLLRHWGTGAGRGDMGKRLLQIRRIAILAILLLAYAYYRAAGNTAALASIGLLSFAAVAQLAPAFFGGMIWRRGTARGAIGGIVAGFAVWAYTLLLPTFADSGLLPAGFVENGPFALAFLRPHRLFHLEFAPLSHGVFWSIMVNVTTYVLVSLMRRPEAIERLQANVFVQADLAPIAPARRLWRSPVALGELMDTVARYLGEERTERSFSTFAEERGLTLNRHGEIDMHVLRYAEHLLASAIGASSSRLVLSLLLGRRDVSNKQALKLLDDASEAIVYNRDLLQTALDHVGQGIVVLDPDMRLTTWNRRFRELLALPPDLGRIGVPLVDILRFCAERGDFGPGPAQQLVEDRLRRMMIMRETYQERLEPTGTVLEVRTNTMPDGGLVMTFTDISERVRTAEALERANETLERRVRERTDDLERINHDYERAKQQAEEANFGKTRFLAAASHDILQPLNAARLYAASLSERRLKSDDRRLASHIDASLDAVEDILGTILDISRLDTGALKPEISTFPISDVLSPLGVEFAPIARDRGLDLRIMPCSLVVRSDRRLLRRLLQNLVSNAVKYTESGRVLVGCRRRDGRVRIEVHDTGRGIPISKQKLIFEEFHRLEDGAKQARGLGLGLSIVERIGRVLDHPVELVSTPGRGSAFRVELPVTAELPPQLAPSRQPRRRGMRTDGLTILCIDNERDILDGMVALLSGWGCKVLCAPSAKAAVRALRRDKVMPDVLLVDYHLDDGNGIDAVVDLRWKLANKLPAILITADRSPAVRDEARSKDIPVLYKPLKAAALRALLAQFPVRREAAE
ncbi:PAS domain-containing hybrid sensor histidine kinase/response regulator [Microbaculum marinisediminis]|uniref:histidine kinase n=1 Tax=Microbaculum marinisediminis TaxID=2931392 RepID=A0AAW5QRH1_9HYPH|nr:PAS domain-containing hybrid sensor histidine kinase/response regulator [Microbaculum sp. A6E488]MCT8970661.1 hybrid sensor histidine kinase/response regulator [Microbaculum sp. A6E488]